MIREVVIGRMNAAWGRARVSALGGPYYCPYSALLSSDEKQRALWESETALDRELRSREVQRVARRPLISHNVACMSYCLGLEANVLMPPFISDFRNADGVFGATLFAVYPHAVSVHLPLGILHDSSRSSEYDESQRMLYLQETRASDFLIDFMSLSSSASVPALGAEGRGFESLRPDFFWRAGPPLRGGFLSSESSQGSSSTSPLTVVDRLVNRPAGGLHQSC
jgi:hypothetical protein